MNENPHFIQFDPAIFQVDLLDACSKKKKCCKKYKKKGKHCGGCPKR